MRGQVRIYQEKIVARKRKELLHKGLIVFAIVCMLVSGFSVLSHLDSFEITDIKVSGANVLAGDAATGAVLEKISGNYLGIFSKTNSLLYPKDAVAAAVAALPPVESVEVSRTGLKSIALDIVEREKEFVWCAAREEGQECYMLDYDGFVFAKLDTIFDDDFVYRGSLAPEPLGTYARPVDEFRKIRFFLEELEGLSVSPVEAEISATDHMIISLERGGKIMVDTKDDLSVILGNIAAVITDRAVAPSLPDFLEKLDYIKLDSGNKVVYKMR